MISSFDQDLTPYIGEDKGQAVEHMEPFIRSQRVVGGACGKLLSVGWLKSSIPACPFCSQGSAHNMFMEVGERVKTGEMLEMSCAGMSVLPLLVMQFS